jgi:hypothetical protein
VEKFKPEALQFIVQLHKRWKEAHPHSAVSQCPLPGFNKNEYAYTAVVLEHDGKRYTVAYPKSNKGAAYILPDHAISEDGDFSATFTGSKQDALEWGALPVGREAKTPEGLIAVAEKSSGEYYDLWEVALEQWPRALGRTALRDSK